MRTKKRGTPVKHSEQRMQTRGETQLLGRLFLPFPPPPLARSLVPPRQCLPLRHRSAARWGRATAEFVCPIMRALSLQLRWGPLRGSAENSSTATSVGWRIHKPKIECSSIPFALPPPRTNFNRHLFLSSPTSSQTGSSINNLHSPR